MVEEGAVGILELKDRDQEVASTENCRDSIFAFIGKLNDPDPLLQHVTLFSGLVVILLLRDRNFHNPPIDKNRQTPVIALNQLKGFYFTQSMDYVIVTYPIPCFDLRAVRRACSQERRF